MLFTCECPIPHMDHNTQVICCDVFFTCEIPRVTFHMKLSINLSHVEFNMRNCTWGKSHVNYMACFSHTNCKCEISHLTFHMCNNAFEFSFVQSYMYNCTRESPHAKFHMGKVSWEGVTWEILNAIIT